jgi:hypothetical protein
MEMHTIFSERLVTISFMDASLRLNINKLIRDQVPEELGQKFPSVIAIDNKMSIKMT